MKDFSIIAVVLLLIAVLGIVSQAGHANSVSYGACVPLGLGVLYLLYKAVAGTLKDLRK